LWRLLTPVALHANLLHLVINNYSLSSLGPLVEKLSGRPRFLAVYAASALVGSVASFFFTQSPSVGASGESLLTQNRAYPAACDLLGGCHHRACVWANAWQPEREGFLDAQLAPSSASRPLWPCLPRHGRTFLGSDALPLVRAQVAKILMART
jgi:hypothetical protein